MELIFIRHGHAEHLLDYPHRLNTLHPSLTPYGEYQIQQLKQSLVIPPDTAIIVSPTKRTIESAIALFGHRNFLVSPLVGPRMYPQNPDFNELTCDKIYAKDEVNILYCDLEIIDFEIDCWQNGINIIDQFSFKLYSTQLLNWLKDNYKDAIIISHDGTITSYRELLGEKGLSRADFLGEAGIYKVTV